MKKQRSKEMSGQEENVHQEQAEKPANKKKLRCLRECEMPGVGLFKAGDVVEHEGKIERIADNPNFEEIIEEA